MKPFVLGVRTLASVGINKIYTIATDALAMPAMSCVNASHITEGKSKMATDEEPPIYNAMQLKLLIASAERLGFWDDVVHFQNELAKL